MFTRHDDSSSLHADSQITKSNKIRKQSVRLEKKGTENSIEDIQSSRKNTGRYKIKEKISGKIDTSISTEANKIDIIIISVTGVILRVTLAVLLFFCSLFFYRLVSNSKTYYTVNHSNTIERYSE